MSDQSIPAGYYPAPHANGEMRWWDGNQWIEPPEPRQVAVPAAGVPVSPSVRQDRLVASLSQQLSYGWRVESQGDGFAVLVRGGKPNHILHLLLTIFTFGLWAIVWIIVAATAKEQRMTIYVDESGQVLFH